MTALLNAEAKTDETGFVTHAIPEISNALAKLRAEQIRPLIVKRGTGEVWLIRPHKLYETVAHCDWVNPVDVSVLKELGKVKVYSLRSASGGFCPTMEEFMAQVPPQFVNDARHMQILPAYEEEPGGDYFSLEVIFYQ